MHARFNDFSMCLKGFFILSIAAASAFASPAPVPSTKRIVQYFGSPLAVGNRVHIDQLINDTRPVYATNVLFNTWTLDSDNTMHVNTGDGNSAPDNSTLDFAWAEIRAVQAAGIPVSMFFRAGFGLLNDEATFEALYGTLRDNLARFEFDGIDLDIEDINDTNPPGPISLEATVKLIQRLRADFGPDFLITLAPVATALAGGINLSAFDYTELEARVGTDIAWYNAQFYGTGALTTELFDAVVANGWAPERIAIGMASSADFQTGTFPLSDLHDVLGSITSKYPEVRGMAAFDYYDQCPGGWAAPWQWPVWAAVRLGLAPASATDAFEDGINTCGANRV